MGLKDQVEFEQMDETTATTETITKDETVTTATTQTADAGVAATTAIAKAATGTAVGAVATKFKVAMTDKNNVFDTATVEGLSLAAPPIKGEQGSLFMGDEDLGSQLQFELISFNHRWAIGTGEDDKEAKEYFRVSYDDETISGEGTSVAAYIEDLKAQGFSKAKKSPYMDLWGFVTWAEKKGEIPVDERQLCRLQCSQTSLGAFTAFCTTRGLLESKGVAKPLDIIEVHAEKRVSGTNKYTNFSFHAPKAK